MNKAKEAKQKAKQASKAIRKGVSSVNKKMPMVFYLTLFIFAVSAITAVALFVFYLVFIEVGWIKELNLVWAIVILLICSIVISTSLVRGLGNRIIFHSIRRIIDGCKAVSEGDFSLRLDLPREKETAEIVESFNEMVGKLGSNEMLARNFIANVSHEFRNPLSSIIGYAQLLGSESVTDEDRLEYAGIIESKAGTLSELINSILELSKLENSTSPIKKEEYRLDEQLRKALLSCRKGWTEKNISLEFELDECIYCGNPELMFEVWRNLIDNAIKYTPENGSIRVTLKNENGITVKVKDNGIGMDAETKERIFDRFYRGSNTRRTEGSGLGMPIVRQILTLHNAEIAIESAVGEGTEITVTL